MSELELPGVEIHEVPVFPPIAGVETSATGFVGEAARGPHGAAVEITSVPEFEHAFGSVQPGWELGEAVQLFFENGGLKAWVVAVPPGASLASGLPGLDAAGQLGLLCLPGEDDPRALLAALEQAVRLGAFLLVDPPGVDPDDAIGLAAELGASGHANGALFFPPVWVGRSGPPCAPSGAVAGMYVRIDLERGIWKAPAGEVLRGVSEPVVELDEEEIARLSTSGVNCIRRLEVPGPALVWGARTFSRDPEWKYVSVRRLLTYLEHSLDEGTRWVVFEPNEERTWSRLRAQCENFLITSWRAGAFAGTTADDAFFVRCGRDTMTQNDIDQGRLIVLVGVAPLQPAEFVVFRIGHRLASAGR